MVMLRHLASEVTMLLQRRLSVTGAAMVREEVYPSEIHTAEVWYFHRVQFLRQPACSMRAIVRAQRQNHQLTCELAGMEPLMYLFVGLKKIG
jgi:hypothetical protein